MKLFVGVTGAVCLLGGMPRHWPRYQKLLLAAGVVLIAASFAYTE